jgi:GH24 family phage-related lysozyme (muramidase)
MQGFNSQIDLTCQPPSNQPTITCTLNPTSVTPPPNGNVPFTLTVSTAKSTPLGNHDIKVHGVSGAIQHSTSITIECDICFPPRTGAQTMSQQGLQFLETKEGNNHSPGINKNCGPSIRTNCHVTPDKYGLYQDSAGHCTQGIGHLVRKGGGPCTPKIISDYNTLFPGGMTQQDALALLATDVREAESHVNNQVKVELTQYQFDALVSFTFNVGGKNLKISNLLRDINNGNCDPATIQSAFLRFTRAGGDPNALVNRRTAEANLFNNGVY